MAENMQTLTPTQEAINQYTKVLWKEVLSCRSEKKAKEIELYGKEQETGQRGHNGKKREEQYKICCLVKAEETWKVYNNLNFCVGIGAAKEAELIKEKLKSLDAKNAELATLLKSAVKCIKDAKDKMNGALEVVCRLDRCVEEEERCNIDIYNALNGIEGRSETTDFWDWLDCIKTDTKSCYEKIGKAFDGAVDVSGIQTFANLESMKPYCDDVLSYITKLSKDIETNIGFSLGEWTKSKDELTTVLQEVSVIEYGLCEATTKLEAKEKIRDFVCNIDEACDKIDDPMQVIRNACIKIQTTGLPNGPGESSPCEEPSSPPPPARKVSTNPKQKS